MNGAVKAFEDLTELFIVSDVREGDNERKSDMGSTRKNTPERLDKIIQYIWNYQRLHNGETPSIVNISNNAGVLSGTIHYFMSLLIDQGRLNKISSRPFRATITEHKLNKAAIARFQKILEKQEAFEAEERERIRAAQEASATSGQIAEDKAAVVEAAEAAFAPDTPAVQVPVPVEDPSPAWAGEKRDWGSLERPIRIGQTSPVPRRNYDVDAENQRVLTGAIERAGEARDTLRQENRTIKSAMPQLIKIAETRDLLAEIVERGYQVSKR